MCQFELGKQHLLDGGFVCWCDERIVLQVALALCALVSEIVSHTAFFALDFSSRRYFKSLFCGTDGLHLWHGDSLSLD